jgi:uncharacterized OB-fold protein
MKQAGNSEIPITAYQCKKCGRIHYPFHDRCLDCRNREFEPVHPQGAARLLTFTAIYNLPWGFDQRYLILGVAEFENKVRAMGQIKAASIEGLRTGMQVQASWEPIRVQAGEDIYGLKFEPVE